MSGKTCKREGCRKKPKSPRAQYCADPACERARARARRQESDQKGRAETGQSEESAPAGGVFSATLTALTDAGRVATPAGQIALALATRIDHGATDSGSSIAQLSKQHLATLEVALDNLATADDPVDLRKKAMEERRLSVVR